MEEANDAKMKQGACAPCENVTLVNKIAVFYFKNSLTNARMLALTAMPFAGSGESI